MRKSLATFLVFLGAAMVRPGPSSFAATPDEVDRAIRKGVEYLYSRPGFKENGNWEESQKPQSNAEDASVTSGQWGGRTALITYALLACGESPNDPALKPAIDFLKSKRINGVYALGLRAQMWLYLKGNDINRLVDQDYAALRGGVGKDGTEEEWGLYGYTVTNQRKWYDLSASQYGVLGMWACEQLRDERKLPSDVAFWQMVDRKWRLLQDKETGGWSYQGNGTTTPSMTAAGLATLFIAQDHLRSSQAAACQGNQSSPEIEKALDYLAAALPNLFDVNASSSWRYYTIYGVERVGVASGLKYLRSIDWYRMGSDFLVEQAGIQGGWGDGSSSEIDTAFALLFLARGREPVMMNKIKYNAAARKGDPTEGPWNQRARDVANAARFTGRQTEKSLNWQIIDLDVASLDDLHDAPIAYLSISRTFNPTPQQLELLKRYVEEGGMLVFNRDCPREGRRGEPDPLHKLLAGLFPYEFRPLPEDHPILRNQQFRADRWRTKPAISGMSNGVRELALVLNDDAGKSFQLNSTRDAQQHFELMVDIYQYAIDKTHALVKGRSYVVQRNASTPARSTIRMGRVRHSGNWDPEPGGWRRLANLIYNQHAIELQTSVVDLQKSPDLSGFDVLHLTGVGAVALPEQTIKALRGFVGQGGVLIVDAAGGNTEFAISIEPQLASILPAAKDGGMTLAPTDPAYTPKGLSTPPFAYRTFTHATVGLSSAPRVRGAKVGDQYRIFYSSDDLSAGLVGYEVDGIRGYTPQSATAIMSRLILYASETRTRAK